MWLPDQGTPQVSYVLPVTAPAPLPADSPTVCVPINADWIPFIVGALSQLTQVTTWDGSGVSAREMQARATDLIGQFINAEACMSFAIRYTSGCQLQFSSDGGTSWSGVPGWMENFPDCVARYAPLAPRLVMSEGRGSPPIPVWDEDATDWVYEG